MAILAGALVLGACGSTTTTAASAGDAPGSSSPPSSIAAPPATAPTSSLRAERYCEVLLLQIVDGAATADVYNSYPLNDCPADRWAALDAPALATSQGVSAAVLNGPRFWLMDHIEKEGGAAALPRKELGGIEMYRQASVVVGPLAEAGRPYVPRAVDRAAMFTFDPGRTVYELSAPDGTTYVMQSWSQQEDPTLGEADLAGLASRLPLPEGWSFAPRLLDAPLVVDTRAVPAHVIQDDLGNSYSAETPS